MTDKVPTPKPGFVIYAQVASDVGEQYRLETGQQTALTLAIAAAIRSGELRTYDPDTGLPHDPPEISSYVRGADVESWLEKVGYAHTWTGLGSKASGKVQSGAGTGKRWDDRMIENLIAREVELERAGVRSWAKQAAKEFNVDPSRARVLKKEYRDRKTKLRDPSLWQAPPIARDPSRGKS
jgi:hypothetical protein